MDLDVKGPFVNVDEVYPINQAPPDPLKRDRIDKPISWVFGVSMLSSPQGLVSGSGFLQQRAVVNRHFWNDCQNAGC